MTEQDVNRNADQSAPSPVSGDRVQISTVNHADKLCAPTSIEIARAFAAYAIGLPILLGVFSGLVSWVVHCYMPTHFLWRYSLVFVRSYWILPTVVSSALLTMIYVLLSFRSASRGVRITVLTLAGGLVAAIAFWMGDSPRVWNGMEAVIGVPFALPSILAGQHDGRALQHTVAAMGAALLIAWALTSRRGQRLLPLSSAPGRSQWLYASATYAGLISIGAILGSVLIPRYYMSGNSVQSPRFVVLLSLAGIGVVIGLLNRRTWARTLFLVMTPFTTLGISSAISNILWPADVPYTILLALVFGALCFGLTRAKTLRLFRTRTGSWPSRGAWLLLSLAIAALVARIAIKLTGPARYYGTGLHGFVAQNEMLNDFVRRFVICDFLLVHYVAGLIGVAIASRARMDTTEPNQVPEDTARKLADPQR